jgi:CHAT domain-containing protein
MNAFLNRYLSGFLVSVIALILFSAGSLYQGHDNATTLLVKADNLFEANLYDSAFSIYQKAAKIFEDNGKITECIQAVTKAGKTLIESRQLDHAIGFLKGHSKLVMQLDALDETTENFYATIEMAYYRAGDAFGALEYQQKVYAINLKREDTPPDKMIELVRVMGILHLNSGQLHNATSFFNRYGELIAKQYGAAHLNMSDAYNYLAITYRYLGEFDLSKDYYGMALATAEAYTREERQAINPRFASIAALYNNVGNVYNDLKDDQQALTYSLKAMDMRIAEHEENRLAAIYSGLGETYQRMKLYDEALKYQQKRLVLNRSEYGENHGAVAQGLKSIGNTYFQLGDYLNAEKYFRQALEMNAAVNGMHHPATSDSYLTISKIQEIKGDVLGALTSVQTGIKIIVPDLEDTDDLYANPDSQSFCTVRQQLLELIIRKADLFTKYYEQTLDIKDLQASQNTYLTAVDLSEIIRNDFVDSRSKNYLAETSKPLFEKCLLANLTLHKLTNESEYLVSAFQLMEKNKSRLLLESIQESQIKSKLDLPDSLFNSENGLKNRIAFLEESILNAQVNPEKDSLKFIGLKEELFATREKLSVLIDQFRKQFPKYHQAKYNHLQTTPHDLQQKAIVDNELLLEFFAGDSTLYMASIFHDSFNVTALSPNTMLYAKNLTDAIQTKNIEDFLENSYKLYSILTEPIFTQKEKLPEKIIIVPDGIISYFPFELLLTEQSSSTDYQNAAYAIKQHTFSYQFSSSLLLNQMKNTNRQTNGKLAAFAPEFDGAVVASRGLPGNIPYARQEIEDIQKTFSGKSFIGKEATENNFKNLGSEYAIIHLATHGIMDTGNPNLSSLYFAESDADSLQDGRLYAYELFNQKISAALVTLSACNTAVGQFKEGEGVMSISRAFAYAGCPSMVTSLWPAQDQTTAEIMKYFYTNLAAGMTKAEALRQAKLTFLAQADKIKSNPFLWAAFILVGDESAMIAKNNINWWAVASVLTALLSVVLYLIKKQPKITI